MNINARAFKQHCGICKYSRRTIRTRPLESMKILGVVFVAYRYCDRCDKGGKLYGGKKTIGASR